jgi:hypothetical protein
MTFEELESRCGQQIKADWHQHTNGGGWVYKDAFVSDEAFIDKDVIIWGGIIRGGIIRGGLIEGGNIFGGTIEGGNICGGTIRGGTIEGGTIRGGTIEGGTIEGGTIRGGLIEGGNICGGTIRGGTIEGGNIEGGNIRGGTIEGGTIRGGTIEGGTICGGIWKVTPLFISDSRGYGASNAKPGWLYIGCERHTFQEWEERFEAIARKHSLNDEEKIEYRAIVDLFVKIGK